MVHFLINSAACLFALWLTYKLLLENTSWHVFKRWYLIGAILISLIIPFIVVETIVVPVEQIPMIALGNMEMVEEPLTQTTFEINWLYVSLSIYAIGVLLMLWRFITNLNSFKIQQQDKISSYKTYQLILRNQITIPHSFLKRIFVSKNDYENNKLPKVVLEHEKAHLDQKHSLDILFMELLIVLLWFNPLLYIIRYSMKLNHEFLADRSVLKQGIPTTEYQQILLDHATTSYQQAMANTFTFPIIKKRFHIMKTHTSNTSLVLRGLALIPILALLIISCGKEETELIEVEEIVIEEQPNNRKIIAVDPSDPEGNITINGEPHYYKIKGDQIDIYNKFGELQDFESQGYEVVKADEIIEVVEVLENLTPENITTYNQLAKKHEQYMKLNDQLIVWENETAHMQTIFNSMNEEQRAANEPWPFTGTHYGVEFKPGQIPPPPPPPVAPTENPGYIKVDGRIYKYTLKENDTNFYDRNGNVIDMYGKTVEYVKKEDLPPPPPPADPLDYIKDKGDKMNYYIDDVKVNAAKAKEFIETNGNKGVQIIPVNGVNSLKMFNKKLKTTAIEGGARKDVENRLQNAPKESKELAAQKENTFVGDPLDVININKDKYMYYIDGHIVDYEKALLVIAKNEHWNVYLDNIDSKIALMINTYDVIVGPQEIKKRGC